MWLLPATALAERRQFNGAPFPASATAEGRLIKGGPFPATALAEGRQFNGAPSSYASPEKYARWLAHRSYPRTNPPVHTDAALRLSNSPWLLLWRERRARVRRQCHAGYRQ